MPNTKHETPNTKRRVALALLVATVAVMGACASVPAWWWGFVGCALAASGLVALCWREDAFTVRQVVAVAVGLRLLLIWLPPGLSDDAYRYVWDGWLQAQGVNPFVYAPDDSALAAFQDAPLFDLLNSASFYSVYPPLSQVFFLVGGLFYDGDWRVSYYVIKALFMLAEVGGLLLLARMTSARLLLLYAWHPLVLAEVAGQAHTEALLVPLLILTVYLAWRGRGGWASVALAGAGLVKLYPFFLFPFLWRRFGWRAVWPGALAAALLTLPYADPSVPAKLAQSLDLYVRYFEFNAGLYYLLKEIGRLFTGDDVSKTLGPFLRAVFFLALPLLYGLDWKRKWPLHQAFVVTTGAYLLLTTTVHPWYLLGVLPLVALAGRPSWSWHALGALSMGTYLLYAGESAAYWAFVIVGWSAWAFFVTRRYGGDALQAVQRFRARQKLRAIRSFFPENGRPGGDGRLRVLDLGAGEGYVGEAMAQALGADVHLADVLDLNRTSLPHVRYDGRTLPFEDDAFDVTVLYFVLHHAEDPERVLHEALRVTRGRVLVAESVYRGVWDRRLLTFLDRWANRLRSGGRMAAQEGHLHFRTSAEWRRAFERVGADVRAEEKRGRWVHKQALFALVKEGGNGGKEERGRVEVARCDVRPERSPDGWKNCFSRVARVG